MGLAGDHYIIRLDFVRQIESLGALTANTLSPLVFSQAVGTDKIFVRGSQSSSALSAALRGQRYCREKGQEVP